MGSEWPKVRLTDFCLKIGSGATPKGGNSVYLSTGNISLIRSQNIYNDGFNANGLVYIDDEAAAKLRNVIVHGNDILLNITGDSVARVCLAPQEYLPARVNQHVSIIRVNPKHFDTRFVRYFLASPLTQQLLLNLASAGATRNALTKVMLEDFEIPKPPLNIQKSIADNLESFDKKILLNTQINQTLEQMAQTLFKSWFVDFDPVIDNALDAGNPIPDSLLERAALRQKVRSSADFKPLPTDIRALFPAEFEETELGWVPYNWEIGKLQDLLVLQRGFDLPASARTDGAFPLVAASGPNGTHNTAMAKAPGVVTGRSGVLGKVFLVLEDFWPLNTTLWIKEFKRASPCYAYELLRQLDFSSFNAGSAVPTLNRNHVHGLSYLLPPTDLVQAFEFIAMPLHRRALENTKQSQTLTTLRDTLLPKLISGQLQLDDLPEVVSELAAG